MRPTRSEIAAFVLALLPFVVFLGDSGRSTVNGVVISQWSYNYAGVILGVAAIVVAIKSIGKLRLQAPNDPRAIHLGIVAAIVALGAYQIARGAMLIT